MCGLVNLDNLYLYFRRTTLSLCAPTSTTISFSLLLEFAPVVVGLGRSVCVQWEAGSSPCTNQLFFCFCQNYTSKFNCDCRASCSYLPAEGRQAASFKICSQFTSWKMVSVSPSFSASEPFWLLLLISRQRLGGVGVFLADVDYGGERLSPAKIWIW